LRFVVAVATLMSTPSSFAAEKKKPGRNDIVDTPVTAGNFKTLAAGLKAADLISWNFEKFIVGRNGKVVARFAPRTKPDDPEVVNVIEAELARK